MADPQSGWSESTSRTFIELADVAVPGRGEQIETLLSLVSPATNQEFQAAELACGEGWLSAALLERFPSARVLALDGSDVMLEEAHARLGAFGDRAQVRRFDLDGWDWLHELPSPLRCVLSSLAIHHLDNNDKRRLFREVASRLEPGGALLIADVVAPASDVVRSAQIAAWHRTAREQSLALTGALETYERAVAEGWGPEAEPDPLDRPGRLFEQLKWLEEAGFSTVDCFWMRAGIAVYGGYR
ncbi:MAG: class I SAM-dependent methyltransferase [Dehalococcoidia bacterium]|nr:class I SAM-dependent methyltransferase [Dehalococcoidia bacterium]